MIGEAPAASSPTDAVRGGMLTSLWTAACRAVESERKNALFHAPFARELAGREGFAILDAARPLIGEAPAVAVRTRFFDDELLRGFAGQVVLLGAGMDARAFRLAWHPGTPVFEVDRPEVLELKRERLGDARPRCVRIEVPIALAEDWPSALRERGFREDLRTVWLAEGLLVYLEPSAVRRLLERVDELSAPSSRFLADLIGWTMLRSPPLKPVLELLRRLGAPWRFGTNAPEQLLKAQGWRTRVEDLRTYAASVGRLLPGSPQDASGFLVASRKS